MQAHENPYYRRLHQLRAEVCPGPMPGGPSWSIPGMRFRIARADTEPATGCILAFNLVGCVLVARMTAEGTKRRKEDNETFVPYKDMRGIESWLSLG